MYCLNNNHLPENSENNLKPTVTSSDVLLCFTNSPKSKNTKFTLT